MVNINSTSGNSYQQLFPKNTDNSNITRPEIDIGAILGVPTSKSTPESSYLNAAYSLNLSPESQKYLNNTTNETSKSFSLTKAQNKKITEILMRYKDAPFNQSSFNKIQDELKASGLSPETLNTRDRVGSFNAKKIFMEGLFGGALNTIPQSSIPTRAEESIKTNNFMKNIVSRWKTISTTAV
jgi:hypothetical protein